MHRANDLDARRNRQEHVADQDRDVAALYRSLGLSRGAALNLDGAHDRAFRIAATA